MAYGVNDKNINRIEEKLINKKTWQMAGEVRGTQREENGLIREELEFDRGLRSKNLLSEK